MNHKNNIKYNKHNNTKMNKDINHHTSLNSGEADAVNGIGGNVEIDNKVTLQDGEEKFSLYTEKIVVNPFVRYRKLFAVIKFVVLAVLFGVIASAVMAWTYPMFEKQKDTPVDKGKDSLVLDKDEYPSDAIMDETIGETRPQGGLKPQQPTQEDDPIETEPMLSYVELLEKIQKSVVIIADGSITGTMPVPPVEHTDNDKETVGVIIGEIGGKYLVLTSYTAVSKLVDKVVKIGDETEVSTSLVSFDKGTDMALVSFNKEDLTDYEKTLIAVAQLDNSYTVKQGDAFVAAGRLYGKVKAADKGFVTSITSEMGIDNCYGVFNTGIRAVEGDYCFLFNGKGNVIGISKLAKEDNKFMANGISDFKSMIEKLSSDSDIVYFGIKGTNVTSSMVTNYNLPYGIYVTEVFIDSPAFNAGLQVGDVITSFNGETLLSIQRFSEKLYSCYSGQNTTITVKRPGMTDYKVMTFNATLGTR